MSKLVVRRLSDQIEERPWAVLAALLVVAAVIRLYLFRGYVGLDDAEYARFAQRLARSAPGGTYLGPAVFPLRVGITVPTAALFRLFGVHEWTMVLYSFVLSLAGIALAFAAANELFGPRAGLVAAAVTALLPWDIDSATKLLPDLPAAVWTAAGVTLLIIIDRRYTLHARARFGAGILAGFAFGVAWLCKESTAYIAPFLLVWALVALREQRSRALVLWIGVAAGAVAVFAGEMTAYHRAHGDFMFRLHEMERNYHQWSNSFFTEGSDSGWRPGQDPRSALVHRLFVSGPAVIFLSPTFLYLPLIGTVAMLFAARWRDRAFLVPSLWLATLVLMFNFSSSSTTSYLPLALFHRYLHPIFFPAALLVGGFLERTVFAAAPERGSRPARLARIVGVLATVAVVLVGLRQLRLDLLNRPTWLSEVRRLHDRVTPNTILYSDAISLRTFEFLNDYPARTTWSDLRAITAPNELPEGSFVLIYPPGIDWLQKNGGMWVSWPAPGPTDRWGYIRDRFFDNPPPSWKLVWQQGDASLYRIQNPRPVTLAGDTHK